MTIKTLNFKDVRTKKNLVGLYLSQLNEYFIIREINKIIIQVRVGLTEKECIMAKQISSREVLLFIIKYGAPDSFLLSQEIQVKIVELKKDLASKIV